MPSKALNETPRIGAIALISVFAIQILRVLFAHLTYNFELQPSNALYLLIGVLAIFLSSLWFIPLSKYLGLRRLLLITSILIASSRFALQVTALPSWELLFSILGTIAFLLLLPTLIALYQPDHSTTLVVGLLLGIAGETALQAAYRTYNLIWREDISSIVVTGLLLLAYFGSLRATFASIDPLVQGYPGSIALLGWGLIFFLNELLFQNLGLVASSNNLTSPLAYGAVIVGNILALLAAFIAHRSRNSRRWPWLVLMGIAFTGMVAVVTRQPLPIPALWIGQIVLGAAWIYMFESPQAGCHPSPKPLAVMTAGSALALALFMLLYFLGYLIPLPFDSGLLPSIAGAIVVVSSLYGFSKGDYIATLNSREIFQLPLLLTVGFILVPIALWLVPEQQADSDVPQAPTSVRVLTYNLHNGFGTDGRLSLPELADTIRASQADVIGLQEVSRGWPINGSIDTFVWLQQRLEMPYAVFAPTADAQWGVALLSKYPITDYDVVPLQSDPSVMRRGFLWASIDLGHYTLPIIVAHLHHLPGEAASEWRVAQVDSLLAYASDHPALVVLGDMNAIPGTPEMELFHDAGWVDAQTDIGSGEGYTFIFGTYIPASRFDWIFVRPELGLSDLTLTNTNASDHLGIAVTVELPSDQ